MAVQTSHTVKRRIGTVWVDHAVHGLPSASYEDALAQAEAEFGEDRIRPIVTSAPAPSLTRLMVNSRTVARLSNITPSEFADQGVPDALQAELLELDPVEGAVGGRAISRWLIGSTYLNIITAGSA